MNGVRPGDVIQVRGSSGDAQLTVPIIQLLADPEADHIAGELPPGHGLRLWILTRADPGNPRAGITFDEAIAVDRDGRFDVALAPRFDLWADDRIEGLASPLAPAVAELVDAQGHVIARAEGHAKEYVSGGLDGDDADTLFLTLSARGEPVRMATGQRVRATIGGVALDVPLPDLRAEVDWATDTISGQGPPGSQLALALQGDRSCRPEPGFSWEKPTDPRFWRGGAPLWQDPDGLFTVQPFHIAPGKRFLVGVLTPSGHRVYRTIQRPSADIDVQRGMVAGCSQPLAAVTAELLDEGARLRSRMEVVADAAGRYALAFRDLDGRPVAIRPTDVVRICAVGDCARLPVKPLAVAMDGSAIAGSVVPGTAGWLGVFPRYPFATRPSYPLLASGPMRWWYPSVHALAPDAGGGFRLVAADFPVGVTQWRVEDLDRVKVWSEIEDGRYLVASAAARRPALLPFVRR